MPQPLPIRPVQQTSLQVEWTTAYDMFKLCLGQRSLRSGHVEDLRAKLREHGFLPDHPVVCYVDGDYFYITDGQHRFEAAKAERIAVPVLILTKEEAVLRLELNNTTTKIWKTGDSLNYYIQKGVRDYELVQLFMDKYNLQHIPTLRLVGGLFTSEPKQLLLDFRTGSFRAKYETLDLAHKRAQQMNEIRDLHGSYTEFRSDRSFFRALFIVLSTPDYDHERMTKKLALYPTMLVKCPTLQSYLALFEQIYNRGLSSKKDKTRFELPRKAT